MTWQPGREKISALVADGELEQVAVSDQVTRRLLEDAARHVVSATAALGGRKVVHSDSRRTANQRTHRMLHSATDY